MIPPFGTVLRGVGRYNRSETVMVVGPATSPSMLVGGWTIDVVLLRDDTPRLGYIKDIWIGNVFEEYVDPEPGE